MADGGIAGDGFHLRQGSRMRAAAQQLLEAAMLETEGDFQMHDLLAVALEAEMAGFDDPGMDRADRHLVNFFPLHPVEAHIAGDGMPSRVAPPGVGTGTPGVMEAHRLEPGMPLGQDGELLGDFPLEEV